MFKSFVMLCIVAIGAVTASSSYYKDLLVLDCQGRLHAIPGGDFDFYMEAPGVAQYLYGDFLDELRNRANCACGNNKLTDEEFLRAYVPGPYMLLNTFGGNNGGMKTETGCGDDLPNSFLDIESDDFLFPSTCTKESYLTDGCKMALPSKSQDFDLTLTFSAKQCTGFGYNYYMALGCHGAACEGIGKPCVDDDDCPGGNTCLAPFGEMSDEDFFGGMKDMMLYDEGDSSPGCRTGTKVLSDMFNHILKWYDASAANMENRPAKLCFMNVEKVDEYFNFSACNVDDIPPTDLPDQGKPRCSYYSESSATPCCIPCSEEDAACAPWMCGREEWHEEAEDCGTTPQDLETPEYCEVMETNRVRHHATCPGVFTTWDGKTAGGTDTFSGSRMTGTAFGVPTPKPFSTIPGVVSLIHHDCEGHSRMFATENYGGKLALTIETDIVPFFMRQIKLIEDCRRDGGALTMEQFRTRFEPHHLQWVLYSMVSDKTFNLGKEMSDWLFLEEDRRRSATESWADKIYWALAGVPDPKAAPEEIDQSFPVATRMLAWAKGARPHEVHAAKALDKVAEMLSSPKQFVVDWATGKPEAKAFVRQLLGVNLEKHLRWEAIDSGKKDLSTREHVDCDAYWESQNDWDDEKKEEYEEEKEEHGDEAPFDRMHLADTCTFEAYSSVGCKLRYVGFNKLFDTTGNGNNFVTLEARMTRCPGLTSTTVPDTADGLPMFSVDCIGSLCEAAFRPTPCTNDRQCEGDLKCVELVSEMGMPTPDIVGQILWEKNLEECDEWGWPKYDVDPNYASCYSDSHGARWIENKLLFAGGRPHIPPQTALDGELKFCFVDPAFLEQAEEWAGTQFEIVEDGDANILELPDLLELVENLHAATMAVTIKDCADFDLNQFAITLADDLAMDPSQLTFTSTACPDIKFKFKLNSPRGKENEDLGQKVNEVTTLATTEDGTLGGKSLGGYAITHFEVITPQALTAQEKEEEKDKPLTKNPIFMTLFIVFLVGIFVVLVAAVVFAMRRRDPQEEAAPQLDDSAKQAPELDGSAKKTFAASSDEFAASTGEDEEDDE